VAGAAAGVTAWASVIATASDPLPRHMLCCAVACWRALAATPLVEIMKRYSLMKPSLMKPAPPEGRASAGWRPCRCAARSAQQALGRGQALSEASRTSSPGCFAPAGSVFHNRAAFSLFSQAAAVLGLVSFVWRSALVIWNPNAKSALRRWKALGVGCLLGGALGKWPRSLAAGRVVDFPNRCGPVSGVQPGDDRANQLAVLFWPSISGGRRAGR